MIDAVIPEKLALYIIRKRKWSCLVQLNRNELAAVQQTDKARRIARAHLELLIQIEYVDGGRLSSPVTECKVLAHRGPVMCPKEIDIRDCHRPFLPQRAKPEG